KLLRDRQRFIERYGALRDPIRERGALDELHDERRPAGRLLESVDMRDVWMVQRSQQVCFTLEPCESLRIAVERLGHHFQRDVPPQLRVARAIDLSHAAGPQQRENLVAADPATDHRCPWLPACCRMTVILARLARRPALLLPVLVDDEVP